MTTQTIVQDAELMEVLDQPLWIARGGPTGVLFAGTLRQCLQAAATESLSGPSPGTIGKPDDTIVVEHAQMYRLWKYIGMVK